MIRRAGTGKLTQGRRAEEDVNPMDGVGNMADAMLILAVGIMLALVMNWNVDLKPSQSEVTIDQKQEMAESDFEGEGMGEEAGDSGLNEMGTVYKDPQTGKLYMVTEGAPEGTTAEE